MGFKGRDSIVKHCRIDLHGCAYEPKLCDEVRFAFSQAGLTPIVRGQKAPAAGVALSADIVITVVAGVTSCLITEALMYAFGKIKGVVVDVANRDCSIGRTMIESESCDYVIKANGSAGVFDEDVKYDLLIAEMAQLREAEQFEGRNVVRIETPCDFVPCGESFKVRNAGVGCFSLWLVEYQDGEYLSYRLYDAANERFIMLGDDASLMDVVYCDDRYFDQRDSDDLRFDL